MTPEELASPDYVKRASVLDDVPMFDASFFGLSPKDASIMDPQQGISLSVHGRHSKMPATLPNASMARSESLPDLA